MSNNQEKDLLYLQIFSSSIFIITIYISIILTINNIQKIDNKKSIFDQKQENNIILKNRIVITIIATISVYISYQFYKTNKLNKNTSKKELYASLLNFISTLILLDTALKKDNKNTDVSIPII